MQWESLHFLFHTLEYQTFEGIVDSTVTWNHICVRQNFVWDPTNFRFGKIAI